MLRSIARLLIAVSTAIPILAQAPSYDLEMHDPDEPQNRNALLVATSGKGRFIYTSITFPHRLRTASRARCACSSIS